MDALNNDVFNHLLLFCSLSAFGHLVLVHRRFLNALASPSFVIRAFQSRYGKANVIAGFLEYPAFMSNEVLVSAAMRCMACHPPCRIYVEELFSRCMSRSDRTTMLLEVASSCRKWYPDLTISPGWSAEMRFEAVCWQKEVDPAELSACMSNNHIPYEYIFNPKRTTWECLSVVERAVLLCLPNNLQLSDLENRLFSILQRCEPRVFDSFVTLYRRSTSTDRNRCDRIIRNLCVEHGKCVPISILWNIRCHFPAVLRGLPVLEGVNLGFLRISTVELCDVSATAELFDSAIVSPLDVDVRWFTSSWKKGLMGVPETSQQVAMLTFLQSRGVTWSLRERRKLAQLVLGNAALPNAHYVWNALDQRSLMLEISLETLCRMLSKYRPRPGSVIPARDWDNARRGFEHVQYPNPWTLTSQRSVRLLQDSTFFPFVESHVVPRSMCKEYFLSTHL